MLYQLSYRGSPAKGDYIIPASGRNPFSWEIARRGEKPVSAEDESRRLTKDVAPGAGSALSGAAAPRIDGSAALSRRPRGGVVTQRTANPCTGVRFPPRPPTPFLEPRLSNSRSRFGDRSAGGPPAPASRFLRGPSDERSLQVLVRHVRDGEGGAGGQRQRDGKRPAVIPRQSHSASCPQGQRQAK